MLRFSLTVSLVLGLSAFAQAELQSASPSAGDAKPGFGTFPEGVVIFDNIGPNGGYVAGAGGSPASQLDEVYPFDAGAADDFGFKGGNFFVEGVNWIGTFFNEHASLAGGTITSFNIVIWPDAGGVPAGGTPAGDPPDYAQALAFHNIAGDANQTDNGDGTFSYSADLPVPFLALSGVTYWLEIQAVFPSPPQWAFNRTLSSQGNLPVQGFDSLSVAYWTPINLTDVDLAFQLTGTPAGPPSATISLEPDKSCYEEGELIVVEVNMTDANIEIVGGQFFMSYDTDRFTFVDGSGGDFPFTVQLFQDDIENCVGDGSLCNEHPPDSVPPDSCDDGSDCVPIGQLDYAVGIPAFIPGTDKDTTMARLTFVAETEGCLDDGPFLFFRKNNPPTRLTTFESEDIIPIKNDLSPLSIDSAAPGITVNATGAKVDENCEGTVTFEATVTDNCCVEEANIVVKVFLLPEESNCCTDNSGGGGGGKDSGQGCAGCDNAKCEAIVCSGDAFCCKNEWDDFCAAEAAKLCGDLCDGPNADIGEPIIEIVQVDDRTVHVTGSVTVSQLDGCPATVQIEVSAIDCCSNGASTSNCCDADDEEGIGDVGCDDSKCEDTVCACDSFCCDVVWDEFCFNAAQDLCGDLCESLTATATAEVTDNTDPSITGNVADVKVDPESCEGLVEFHVDITDNCRISTGPVNAKVELISGQATLESPQFNVIQENKKHITANILVAVSDVRDCPATIQLTVDAVDHCGNPAGQFVLTANVTDNTLPLIENCTIEGSTLDEDCSGEVCFSATVNDNCCLDAGNVKVLATLTGGCGTLGFPDFVVNQLGPDSASISGCVPISDVDCCLSTVEIMISADDCCDNAAVQCVLEADVVNEIPPTVSCPGPAEVSCFVDVPEPATNLAEFAAQGGKAIGGCDAPVEITHVGDNQQGEGCPSTITRTYRAVSCGVELFCDQIITVDEQEAPVISCPPAITIDCDDDLDPVNNPSLGVATATDNCDPDPEIIFFDSPAGACPTVITRHWSATDECGNESTCDQIITLNDDDPPVFTVFPPDIKIQCDESTDPSNTGQAEAVDNCDPDPEVTFSDGPGVLICPTAFTRTWTATDTCGNFITADQEITVSDDVPPVFIIFPVDKKVQCNESTDPDNTGQAVAEDNCALEDVFFVDDPHLDGCNDTGFIIRTWTAIDLCQNPANRDQIITVSDNDHPDITFCPGPIKIQCDESLDPSQNPSLGEATATDNCDPNPSVTFSDVSGLSGCNETGIVTRTWTATDACGNDVTCEQIITVSDDEDPVITCPADLKIQCDESFDPAQNPSLGVATATDNCDPEPTSVGFVDDLSGLTGCNNTGSFSRTWTATDDCGNTATCKQLITVNDDQDPQIDCPPNITLECDEPDVPDGSGSGEADASDNCGLESLTHSDDDSGVTGCNGTGTRIRTWTATDFCGRVASCDQIITIVDTTAPEVTCGPIKVVAGFFCDALVFQDATATDNCDADPPVVSYEANFDTGFVAIGDPHVFPLGNTPVRARATDNCGNPSEFCFFLVTVNDEDDPVETCPEVEKRENDSGLCGADVTFSCTVEDNCPDPTIECVPASGTFFVVGDTGVVCTATDGSGNTDVEDFVVTVNDEENPVPKCPDDIVQDVDLPNGPDGPAGDGCSAFVTWDPVLANDNCLDASVVCVPAPGEFPVGTTEVICTATDASDNTGVCAFDVTINDDVDPVAQCPADIFVNSDAGICGASFEDFGATASDNCPGVTIVCVPPPDFPFPVGTTEVTCTASDASTPPNTNDCTFNVNVTSDTSLDVEVELEQVATDLDRCITVTLYNCDTAEELVFSDVFAFIGGQGLESFKIPCGDWDCISAKDELHTLRRTLDLQTRVEDGDPFDVEIFFAEFTGPIPDALTCGDMTNDNLIDVLDFGNFILLINQCFPIPPGNVCPGDPDTNCSMIPPPPFHPDFDGDGQVSLVELPCISSFGHFATFGDDVNLCCGGVPANAGPEPRLSIDTASLALEIGSDAAEAADVDGNGVLDLRDIELFYAQNGIPVPQNIRELASQQRSERAGSGR